MRWTADRRMALAAMLAEYREKNALTPGRLVSRATVLDTMRECPAVPRSFFEGVNDKALDNRLWRFEAGKETKEETLDALHAFLSTARLALLRELDEDEDADEEMLAVYNLMANASPLARTVFDAIAEGVYSPKPTFNTLGLELKFTRHAEHMLMLVEERWYEKDSRLDPADPILPTRRGESCKVRSGYAFVTTEHYLMHVFLKGKHARDRVHYIQPGGLDSDGNPYLIRLGGDRPDKKVALPFECQAYMSVRKYVSDAQRPQPAGKKFWGTASDPLSFRPPGTGEAWGIYPLATRPPDEVKNRFLIRAASASIYEDTRYALNSGANPNWQDEEGWTALHHAASSNARTAIRLLVASAKCDYLIRDNKGRYASDLALLGGHSPAMARLLSRKRREQAARLGVPSRA